MLNIEKNYKQNDLLKTWLIISQVLDTTIEGIIKKIGLVTDFNVEIKSIITNGFTPPNFFNKSFRLC